MTLLYESVYGLRDAQPYPGILVSPAPASSIHEPRIKGVEELGLSVIWEQPIPRTHEPPQMIPAVKKMSPSPSLWPYLLCFGVGLFIGLPLGREILKMAAGISEAEIRRKLKEARARRGL